MLLAAYGEFAGTASALAGGMDAQLRARCAVPHRDAEEAAQCVIIERLYIAEDTVRCQQMSQLCASRRADVQAQIDFRT